MVTDQVKTITITPTISSSGAVLAQLSLHGEFISNPGKVAGSFVGVALIICLLAAAFIWSFICRKRNAKADNIASTAGRGTAQQRPSNICKSVPTIQTRSWGQGIEKSPTDKPTDYRRTIYPRLVDQRLEPAALWNPLQDNGSYVSIRDEQDYSRRILRRWAFLLISQRLTIVFVVPSGCKFNKRPPRCK